MKLVPESLNEINFERGIEPKDAMGIGTMAYTAMDRVQKEVDDKNQSKKPEYQWKRFGYPDEIEWSKDSRHGPPEIIKLNLDKQTISYKNVTMWTIDFSNHKRQQLEGILKPILERI